MLITPLFTFYDSGEDPVHLHLDVLLEHGDACHAPLQPGEGEVVRPFERMLKGFEVFALQEIRDLLYLHLHVI